MRAAVLLFFLYTSTLAHPRRRVEYDIAYPAKGPITWSEGADACIANENRDPTKDGQDTSWRLASYADSRELRALQVLVQDDSFTPCWIGLKQNAGQHNYQFEDHTEGFSTSHHSDVDQCVYMARHASTNNATFGVRTCSSGESQEGSDDQTPLPAIRRACCGRVSDADVHDDRPDADDHHHHHDDGHHHHDDDVLEVHDHDDQDEDADFMQSSHALEDDHGDDHTHDVQLMIGLLNNNRTARLQHAREEIAAHSHDDWAAPEHDDDTGDDAHHHHHHHHGHKHDDDDLHAHTDDSGTYLHTHDNDGEHAHDVTAEDIADDHTALSLMGSLFSTGADESHDVDDGHKHHHRHKRHHDDDSGDDSGSNDSDDGKDDGHHHHKHNDDDHHRHKKDDDHHHHRRSHDDSQDDSDSYVPEHDHYAHGRHRHASEHGRSHHHRHASAPHHRHRDATRRHRYHTPRHHTHAHHAIEHRYRHPAYHAHSLPRDDFDSYESDDYLHYDAELEEPSSYDSYDDVYSDPYSASEEPLDSYDESYEDSHEAYVASHPWHHHHHSGKFYGHHGDPYPHRHRYDDASDDDDKDDSPELSKALELFASSLGAVATHDHVHGLAQAADVDSWAFLLQHPYYMAVFMFALAGGFMYYGW